MSADTGDLFREVTAMIVSGRIFNEIPTAYIVTSILMLVLFLGFVEQSYDLPPEPGSAKAAEDIRNIPDGSKVLILVNYGPEGRYELETGLASLLTILAKKEVGIVFASLIPQGIESTSLAVEKSISKINFRKQGYFYGKDYVQLGYLAGGSISAAMMTGDIENYRREDIFGNKVRDLPVMNGVFSLKDLSAVIEFSSVKIEGVPGIVFFTVFNRKSETPSIAVCTSDMVSDYVAFADSGSITALVQGMKGIVSFEKILSGNSESGPSFFSSVGVLWLVFLLILAGNIGKLLRKKK